MGRFSQLETGGLSPDSGDALEDSTARLRARREDAEKALNSGPSYDAAYYLAEGNRYFYTGQFEKALRQYSRAIQQKHAEADSWVGQVLCLVMQNQPREVQVWAKRALELFPEDPRLISLQGLGYALTGSTQRAMSASDFALQRRTPSALAWLCRGVILTIAESPNANACFDKVLELREGNDWQITLLAGMLLISQRRYSVARLFLEQAISDHPRSDYAYERVGFVYERLGQGTKAAEAYKNAMQLNPQNLEAARSLRHLNTENPLRRLFRKMFGKK